MVRLLRRRVAGSRFRQKRRTEPNTFSRKTRRSLERGGSRTELACVVYVNGRAACGESQAIHIFLRRCHFIPDLSRIRKTHWAVRVQYLFFFPLYSVLAENGKHGPRPP